MKRCILDCRVWGLGDGAVDADEERLGDDGDEIHDVCVQCALCTVCVLFFHVGGCLCEALSLLQLTAWVIVATLTAFCFKFEGCVDLLNWG